MKSKKSYSMGIEEVNVFMEKIDRIRSDYPYNKRLNEEFDAQLINLGVEYLNSDQDSQIDFLIDKIKTIESDFVIKQHEFDLLEEKLFELRAIYMRSDHMTCKAIAKFYQDKHSDHSATFMEFKSIQNCLKNKGLLINYGSAIRKDLDRIESYIDENDKSILSIVELLPEWFWVLIRSQDLAYFKAITHFEELKDVGIRSCEDVLGLGVSMKKQQCLQEFFQEIFTLPLYEKEEREKILEICNQLVRIDLKKEEFEKYINELAELTIDPTNPIGFNGIKKLLVGLYFKIQSLDFILSSEKSRLKKEIKDIQRKRGKYDLSIKGKELLKEMVIYLHLSHPRVALQKYLNQDNLIEKWKNLQSQGFQSIDDLIKKKQLPVSELFDL